MSHPQDGKHNGDQRFVYRIPPLWNYWDTDPQPILQTFGDVRHLLHQTALAVELGLRCQFDFYSAPISDTEEIEEAHLTVWRELYSDASLGPRPEPDRDEEHQALLHVAGLARSYRTVLKDGPSQEQAEILMALRKALDDLDEVQGGH